MHSMVLDATEAFSDALRRHSDSIPSQRHEVPPHRCGPCVKLAAFGGNTRRIAKGPYARKGHQRTKKRTLSDYTKLHETIRADMSDLAAVKARGNTRRIAKGPYARKGHQRTKKRTLSDYTKLHETIRGKAVRCELGQAVRCELSSSKLRAQSSSKMRAVKQ
jgi:hypothetical protein